MLLSLAIIAFSIALFAYWFRYSCLLILDTRTTAEYAGELAEASGVNLQDLQVALQSQIDSGEIGRIAELLDRDYARVKTLLDKAPRLRAQMSSAERWMLRVDYRLMRAMAAGAAAVSPDQAKSALLEMCSIVDCFANDAACCGGPAE